MRNELVVRPVSGSFSSFTALVVEAGSSGVAGDSEFSPLALSIINKVWRGLEAAVQKEASDLLE